MLLTYNFTDTLDLTKFQKQATHYIGSMFSVIFDLYLPSFKIVADVMADYLGNGYHITTTITLFALTRNQGEIVSCHAINPLADMRFSDIPLIQEMFDDSGVCKSTFTSNNIAEVVDKVSFLLKLLSKIDRLRAFV